VTANYAPEASNKAAICAGVVWTHVIVDWAWAIAVPSIVAHITTAILMPFRIGLGSFHRDPEKLRPQVSTFPCASPTPRSLRSKDTGYDLSLGDFLPCFAHPILSLSRHWSSFLVELHDQLLPVNSNCGAPKSAAVLRDAVWLTDIKAILNAAGLN
jgi:hypothetical protein